MDAITIPGTRGFPCAVSGFESSRPRSFFLLRRSCLRPNIASKTSGIQGTITTVRRWICRVKLENWSFTYLKQVWRKQFPVDIIFVAFLEIWSAYHLNGIFGSFFWTNGAAIFSSKETNWIDWTVSFDRNSRMPVGRGLGTCHQETCRARRRFIGRLGKGIFWRTEKATISSVWLLQHPHFVRETGN